MSKYTELIACPDCRSVHARYFPPQDGLPAVIDCGICGHQISSDHQDFKKIHEENFVAALSPGMINEQF